MTVEIHPVGLRCGARNGATSCVYCYERPLHRQNDAVPALDLEAAKRQVEAGTKGGDHGFSLFGGEALLAPLETLEALWAWGLARYGKNGVQTGGRPIREEHFALFHKYKVNVSFSVDGPGALNDARVAGTLEQTREATAHVHAMLERCVREGLCSSVIVTLNTHNASEERLPALGEWVRHLHAIGVTGINFHVLEVDGPGELVALTHEENLRALLYLWQLTARECPRLDHVQPFRDLLAVLRGRDEWKWNDGTSGGVGCIWTACDPLTTPAVYGVEADGSRSLCSRVHKGRTAWGPAPRGALWRQLVLRATPQAEGGCQGCRQMITCKGQCPGTAEFGDWRRRSRDCALWRALLEHGEGLLLEAGEVPVTLRPDRDAIEARMSEWWAAGRDVRLAAVLRGERPQGGTYHGDHGDHGDHTDAALAVPHLKDGEVVK